MLKEDPQHLWELYQSAVKKRDRRLATVDDSLERYVGPAWLEASYAGEIENPEFELVAQVSPRIVWDNPRVRISTDRPGPAQLVARALNSGVNRNILNTNIREPAKRVLIDMLFRFGVMFTSLETVHGYGVPRMRNGQALVPGDGKPMRPRSTRISFRRYFEDPTATCRPEIRFRGHECIGDIDDLLARAQANPDEGWNVELLERLQDSDDVDTSRIYRPGKNEMSPKRGEIAWVEMYLDAHQLEGDFGPDEGFNGAWFTLFISGSDDSPEADFLRDPYMAFGPPGGLYTVFGEYLVPDDESPLAGIEAGAAVLKERSDHQLALSRAAARRKRIALTDGFDDSTSDEIRDSEDGDVIKVPGLDANKVKELELAGVTETGAAYKEYLDRKCDRLLGADDASRGNVTGIATAAENKIAFNAVNTRQGGTQHTFDDAMGEVLTKEAWLMFYMEKVAFPLPPEARALVGRAPGVGPSANGPVLVPPDPWFRGGNVTPGSGFTFEDLALRIEPYSMTRTSPEVQAAQGAFLAGPFFDIVERLIRNPAVPPDKLLAALADALNNPTLVDLVDIKILRLLQGLGLGAMMMPTQGQPQLAGDVGAVDQSGITQMRQAGGSNPDVGGPGGGGGGGGFRSRNPRPSLAQRSAPKGGGAQRGRAPQRAGAPA